MQNITDEMSDMLSFQLFYVVLVGENAGVK